MVFPQRALPARDDPQFRVTAYGGSRFSKFFLGCRSFGKLERNDGDDEGYLGLLFLLPKGLLGLAEYLDLVFHVFTLLLALKLVLKIIVELVHCQYIGILIVIVYSK